MDSKDIIKAGNLSEARKKLIEEVKRSPADMGKRAFLSHVYAFSGEWEKAERQLDVIIAQEPDKETGVQVYKNLINAEKEREEVSRGARPSFLPKMPPYLEIYYVACEKLSEKKIDEASELFAQVEAQVAPVSGTINGKEFTGFRDTDAFCSLFLETMINERYVLIPFESIKELSVSPPKTFVDLLWISAHIVTCDELTLNCYIPVLYQNSSSHDDDRVKLGRMTDWTHLGGAFSRGHGQRVFDIGEEEVAVLEVRDVVFNP